MNEENCVGGISIDAAQYPYLPEPCWLRQGRNCRCLRLVMAHR